MTPYYQDERITLWHGDCLEVLRSLPDASVDSVVTDPPYGLEFMGKDWDAPWKASSVGRGVRVEAERAAEMTERGKGHATPGGPFLAARVDSTRVAGKPFQDWCELWATECLRVLKPGGHLLAFGGTRTWHRLACAVEDAGFEMRDSIAWLYGSGFPKSLDVSKAIDKAAGANREVVGRKADPRYLHAFNGTASSPMGNVDPRRERTDHGNLTAPATPDAQTWQGWGTALKPAFEPIVVARKPLSGTVAANVLAHGTGALNIDGCRVEGEPWVAHDATGLGSVKFFTEGETPVIHKEPHGAGRWPANVLLDESQAEALDKQSGATVSRIGNPRGAASGDGWGMTATGSEYADEGGASRFFPTFRYEAKAPTAERPRHGDTAHPTVKPLDLMRWLLRLVTPPGGLVLDPFVGSGTTGEAAIMEGFRVWLIEREADYLPLILHRIERAQVPLDFTEGTLTAPDAPALGEVTLADLERYLGPLTPEAEAWGQCEALPW